MGRNIYYRHVNDELEDDGYHPGCMWGFIHALDYNHWHYNVKKMLHHEKYEGGRHAKGKVNPKTSLILHDSDEVQQLLEDSGRSHLLVNQNTKNSRLANKKSIKARIKALIAEEVSKQENGKKQKSGYSPRPQLQRTYSIHHLEPSYYGLNKISTDEKPAAILLPSTLDDGNRSLDSPQMKVPNKPDRSNMHSMKNGSERQLKKDTDILEISNANKDLFLKIGNADDSTGKFFNTLPNSSRKARLTKSGSFPLADLSRRRNYKPIKLESKKNEIWFSPKGERLLDYAQVPELALPKYKMNFRAKSWTLASYNEFSKMDQKSSPVSQKSKTELMKEGNDEMVMPVEVSKQRVEPEAKEDTSEGGWGSSPNVVKDEFSSGDLPSVSEKDTAGRSGERAINRDDETHSINFNELDGYSLSKMAASHRRCSSLNESRDRYAQLFKYSARQEVILHSSKSLKLRNEYDPPSDGQVLFRRIRSLSLLDFCYPIENEGPGDAHHADWPIETVENSSFTEGNTHDEEMPVAIPAATDGKATLDASNETVNEIVDKTDTIQTMGNMASLGVNMKNEGSAELDDLIEKVDDSADDKSTSYRDVIHSEINADKLSQSFLVSNSGASLLRESSPTYSSEGLENGCKHDGESNTYLNLEERVNSNSLSYSMPNIERCENANANFKTLDNSEFYKNDDADLLYVKEILERSGLFRDVFPGISCSAEQPLETSVFKEMEAHWHQELECSKEDMYDCSHHQLLYDLVIEVIVQIYDRSFTVYPKALSSSCRVRPLPMENHIHDEVYANINKLLSRKPNRYQTLDDIVSGDLTKDDGWMNLQSESECVALELEDIILDELLEELLCP